MRRGVKKAGGKRGRNRAENEREEEEWIQKESMGLGKSTK